jgi:VWFA-related protein
MLSSAVGEGLRARSCPAGLSPSTLLEIKADLKTASTADGRCCMITHRLLAVCIAVGLTSLTVSGGAASPQEPAQPPAGAGGQPTFRGGVDFVRVDVVVTDRSGRPVLDLEPGDFEVREDGRTREIEQFRVIEIDGNPGIDAEPPRPIRSLADEEIESQREDVRLFAFFLDDYHVRRANAVVVREPLVRFIETQLRPNDMVGVMYPLTPVNDVLFTRDHQSVIRAIESFEGRKYEYDARNAFERNYERESTEVVERIRNDVVLGALEGLALRMGGLREGRKSVVFVSEGLMTLLPAQMRRMNAQAPQLPIPSSTDEQVEAMAELEARNRLETRLREVYRAANRNNTSIYALDPRGLAPFEFDISDGAGGAIGLREDRRVLQSTQDTLRSLAEETDGRAIVNRNSLAEGLTEMVRDSSFYYLLGYTSQVPSDGKFHEIDVRVRRSGITVRARRGFWAPSEENIQQLTAARARPEAPKRVLQALATLSPAIQAARFVRTWVGTEQGTDGKTRVSLVWEPLPAQAAVRREQAGAVAVLALDQSGDLVFRGRSEAVGAGGPPGGRGGTAGARAAAPQRIVFESAPGAIDVRLSIEAVGGGTIDTETQSLAVPDLAGGTVALSTPRVYRSRTAVELRGITADGSAVPTISREFSRTERLLLRFDVYGPGTERPAPRAAILGRNGEKIGDVPVTAAQAGGTHQIEMALNSMAAGDYVIEISVDGATGETATELVPFRLGA